MSKPTIAFIGGGNMARSLIGGLIQQWQPEQIIVAEPYAELREALARDFAVRVTSSNVEAASVASIWVIAVKPQVMKAVCAELAAVPALSQALIVSIAAGIQLAAMRKVLGAKVALVRSMPNTPALIGQGITALFAGTEVGHEHRQWAEQIMQAAGRTVWVADEALMDVVTATSGSGPAYFFLLIEAMQQAAIAQGLPADVARELVLQTALGAARMAVESGEDASVLRQRVTSPNGTTQAALESFAASGFSSAVDQAIRAATLRGRELSNQLS
jgi:pyrroline-5-carboxylate reductase